VPAIEAFVAGLTGNKSLASGFKDSQLAAYNFGEDLKGLIKTVISLKDQIIFVGTAIAGVFTVAAIAGGVASIVTAIKTLITAYNALKASAIVAGIASYFALNPLAGLGATAVAAGILAGANALARNSDVSTDFSGGGTSFTYGSGNPLDFSAGVSGGGGAGGGFTGGGLSGGGAGGSSGAAIGNAAAAVNLPDLVNKLQNISDKIGETTFLLESGAISESTASKLLNPLIKQFDVITNQVETLNSAIIPMVSPTLDYTTPFAGSQASPGQVIINLRVDGAIDSEGTARTIVDTLNDSYYRGTNGATILAGLR
jgi:hypothetical protein